MIWTRVAEVTSDILTVVVIVRFLSLSLHHVYRIVCAFLAFDLVFSLVGHFEVFLHNPKLDYRITWILLSVIGWALSLCMVYGLLQAILQTLPGILRFSRKLLNVTFISVVAVTLVTTRVDAAFSGPTGFLSGIVDPVGRAVRVAFDLERIISTVALLVLLFILGFVLWFPVRMPRNLVVLSIGLVVYFAANTALMLTRGLWSEETLVLVSNVITFILSACYACWAIAITREGETTPVRIGHSWNAGQQERLVSQLEAMNAALMRGARRSAAP